jgi:hypothetical protein
MKKGEVLFLIVAVTGSIIVLTIFYQKFLESKSLLAPADMVLDVDG